LKAITPREESDQLAQGRRDYEPVAAASYEIEVTTAAEAGASALRVF
jgi:hypothetical protein